MRTLSRLGVDVRVGIGSSVTVAATASAQVAGPGGVLAVEPGRVAEWLGALPVGALHGIGPRQAQVLGEYGIHCVGELAGVPPATVQRLLGGKSGPPGRRPGPGHRPPPRRPSGPARLRHRPLHLPPVSESLITWAAITLMTRRLTRGKARPTERHDVAHGYVLPEAA